MPSLTWLHFSDFHSDRQRHKDFWGNIRQSLCDDLKDLQKKHGTPDLIIFSGDLARQWHK